MGGAGGLLPPARRQGAEGVILPLLGDGDAGASAHEGTPGRRFGTAPNGYPFFALFFYCRLCPPFSEFFCDIMNTYGLRLLDFTPNAILTMAVFAHLCENFVGVHPNVALFRHFFMP